MALSTMMGLVQDAGEYAMRLMGRRSKTPGLEFINPQQMITDLRNPATEARAVARMRKMHYGAFYGEESRNSTSWLAERELLTKGKGFSGAVFGRPIKGLSIASAHLGGALMFAPLQGIVEASMAPKRHKMSSIIGGTSKAVAWGVGDAIGTLIAGPVAGFALGLVTEKLGGIVEDGVQMFNDYARSIRHVNMGGNYEDTRVAYTMRQRAAQEMGTSVMNARSWLGKEGILMHQ